MVVSKETTPLLLIKGHYLKRHTILLEGLLINWLSLNLGPPNYNEVDNVAKTVSNMERMIRELKEFDERMMKIMNEQFVHLPCRIEREKHFIVNQSQPEKGSFFFFL